MARIITPAEIGRSVNKQNSNPVIHVGIWVNPFCRVPKRIGSQVDVILNKEVRADSRFYRGL